MPIIYNALRNWKLEEVINLSSVFGYLPEDMLEIFKREYIAKFPDDTRGEHFNENMGIMDWDE